MIIIIPYINSIDVIIKDIIFKNKSIFVLYLKYYNNTHMFDTMH